MNKKIFTIIFIFFISFIFMNKVSAVSSATINSYIDDYYSYKDQIDSGICDEEDNEESINKCNKANLQKNLIVSKLMKYYSNENLSSTNKRSIEEIIKENKDKCTRVLDDELQNLINNILKIFYIIGPILLIVFGTLDYSKVVISSEKDALKKANQKFIKRVIATIFLFLSPALTNIIIGLNVSDYYLSGNAYACEYEYKQYSKEWEIEYTEAKTYNLLTGNSASTSIKTGGITTDEEMNTLSKELTSMLNTEIHLGNGKFQSGPFPQYWTTPDNTLEKFQCTWWANGRASQYLALNGTVYKEYPTERGHGGQYYSINKENGYFNYGQTPKANSIISWTKSGSYGHVAYVEGVSNDAIYISHAGSGKSWRGVEKIPLSGELWSGYTLNGYIYLDEPLQKNIN